MFQLFLGFSQGYDIGTIKVNNNNFSVYLEKKLYLDDDGFLWYSTKDGVVKEMGNGKSFFFEYAFDKEKHDQVLITSKLFKSSTNKLWACTEKGLNCLDLKTASSKWIELKYPKTNLDVIFTDIAEDELGNIWLGTDKNFIYRITPNGNILYYKIESSEFPATDSNRYRNAQMELSMLVEDNSLVIHQDNQWIQFKNEQSKLLNIDESASSVLLPNGAIFDSNTSGVYTYKDKIYNYTYLKAIDCQVLNMPFSTTQYIPEKASKNFYHALNFIATDENLLLGFKMKTKNNKHELILKDFIPFKHNITNAIYDPAGHFWLHNEDGLKKINYNDVGFKKHIDDQDISCRGFTENAEGTIYVFTNQGLFKKNKASKNFQPIDLGSIKDLKTYDYVKNNSSNFYNQNDEIFWFYGFHDSLIAFNIKAGTFETYAFPLSGVSIVDAQIINGDVLMLASSKGLYAFSLKTKSFKNESILNDDIDLNNVAIKCITLSKDQETLWIGTSGKNALIKQDLKTKRSAFFNTSSKLIPLIDNDVKIIYEDNANNLWIGTPNGLQYINQNALLSINFNSLKGFSNGNIAGILECSKNIWVSTFNGLVKVDKNTQAVQTYYEVDGLMHNEFNAKSYFKSSDSLFYFGGINGVTSFNPNDIAAKSKSYNIVLTDYQMYNEALEKNVSVRTLLDEGQTIKEFNIPYEQNYLTLNFSINDLFNAEKNVYQYRIKELSEEWIDLGNYSKLDLRGMNPGNYAIEIKGFSSNGNPTNTLKYSVHIEQIFYKELWFVSLTIFMIFSFISVRNHRRRQQVKKEFDLKGKIIALESKAVRAQMNPHFIFNTLNGMQSVMILKGERAANKYFTAFSKLLRLTLDMSNSEYVLLKNEIIYLNSYLELENLRLDNKINIQFNVDPDLDIENKSIPCMLFQPIIENAIIHGLSPKKEDLNLTINFKKHKNSLLAEVIDNGIGRSLAMKIKQKSKGNHKSWATHIMKERINISNSINKDKITWAIIDLKDETQNAQGTKVVMCIPLKENLGVVKTE